MKATTVTTVLAAVAMLAVCSPAQGADSAPVSVMNAQPVHMMSLQRMPADMQAETREDSASRNHFLEPAVRISEVSLGQQQGCFVELAGVAGMRLNGVRVVADYDHGRSVMVLRGNMGSDGYYLLASSPEVGSADMVNPAVCLDNDVRRVSLTFGNVVLSSVDMPEGSMPGVAASCMSAEGSQWQVLSHASPGYENACDCIDFDGDGYGVGPGCRGPDCSDLLVNCNIDCRQDVDFDSIPDCFDECPLDPHKLTGGECGCGVPDVDSDHDGFLDCVDECPNDPEKHYPGLCGCGMSNGDSDGDSIPDCIDECPADRRKFQAGVCGCGVDDTDHNRNGVMDCLESDTEQNAQSEQDTENRMSGWEHSGAAVSHPSIHYCTKLSTGTPGSPESSTQSRTCEHGAADTATRK
jgi:hypothetical protein